jgi:hypothetical protein
MCLVPRYVGIVPLRLGPFADNVPIELKCLVCAESGSQPAPEAGNTDEFCQIVRIAVIGKLLIRKVMPLDLFGNACFQATFDCIAGQVISGGISMSAQKRTGIRKAISRQCSKFTPIHCSNRSVFSMSVPK